MKTEKLIALVRKNLPTILKSIAHAQDVGQGQPGIRKLDLAVEFVNARIDIPLLPESIERSIIRGVITGVVELAKLLWGEDDWFKSLLGLARLQDAPDEG